MILRFLRSCFLDLASGQIDENCIQKTAQKCAFLIKDTLMGYKNIGLRLTPVWPQNKTVYFGPEMDTVGSQD